MSKIIVTPIYKDSVGRWNKLLAESEESTYQNSYDYQHQRNEGVREIESFIFSFENKDIAGVHYTMTKRFLGLFKIANISSGLVFKHTISPEVVKNVLSHFLYWAKQKKASYCKVNLWIPSMKSSSIPEYIQPIEGIFTSLGFYPIQEGKHTYQIDISRTNEEILADMNSGTRRKIRKGLDSDVEIKIFETADENEINQFWKLYNYLGKKKGFTTLSEKSFKIEVRSLLNAGQGAIQVLKYNNQVINISFVTFVGMGMYYHGAVNHDVTKQKGCPSAGHMAQWQMIQHLKREGHKKYDMAFCPGPVPQKNHPLFDMWRFKFGFGGEYIRFMPIYGKVLNPLTGNIIKHLK